MIIELTTPELWRAARIGCGRHIENLLARRRDTYGLSSAGWSEHITGAIGELAVAKAMEIEWTPQTFARRHDGDIGSIHEVRTTLYPNGALILNPNDAPDRYYWLVAGRPPEINVVGCIKGEHGKRDEWWDTRRTRTGAFMIPQDMLLPIESFRSGDRFLV